MRKPFYKSTTLQGIALVAIGILVKYFTSKGWIGAAENASITELLDYLSGTMQAGGLGLAIYGRAKTGGESLGLGSK